MATTRPAKSRDGKGKQSLHRNVVAGLADVVAGRTQDWDSVRAELLGQLAAREKSAGKKRKRA